MVEIANFLEGKRVVEIFYKISEEKVYSWVVPNPRMITRADRIYIIDRDGTGEVATEWVVGLREMLPGDACYGDCPPLNHNPAVEGDKK